MPVIRTKYDKTKVCDTPLFKEFASVQEVFSVVSIDESGIFELTDKKYSKLYRLSDINAAGVTEDELKAIIIRFSKVLKTIPCRFSYSVANEYVDEKEYNEKILFGMKNDGLDGLRRSFNEVIKEKVSDAKQGLYQTIYLTLTIEAEDMLDAKSSFFSIEGAIRSAFIGLGINGMQGSVMSPVSINERMQMWYKFTHVGEASDYQFDFERELMSNHDWLNIVSPACMCFENESFSMNGVVGKVMFIEEYPKTLESDIITSLSKINCTSYITVNNELLDIAGFKQEIARKYMKVGMKIESEKQRNRNNNDYLADASTTLLSEKEKLDSFLKEIDTLDDHYFNSTIMIMFLADTQEELGQIEQKIENVAGLKSLKLKSCFGKQKEGLNSTFPFGIEEFKHVVNLSSTCLAMFLPFKTQELNDEGGIFMGVNQLSQNAIFANKKKLKNRNSLSLGQTGSGKSMTTKIDIVGNVIQNPDDQFIILDLMKEYRGVSGVVKGTVISLDASQQSYLNPCDVDFKGVDYIRLREIISEKADFILSLLSSCLKRDITPEEQGVIDSVIEKVYSENYAMRKRLNGEVDEESDFEVPEFMRSHASTIAFSTELSNEEQIRAYSPTLQDIYQGLIDEGSKVGLSLSAAMEIFVNGSLNLFNHRTNVDTSNRFIVFDLSGLKDNLRITSMLIMMETIKGKLKENAAQGKWTHIYIDEFHELLSIEQVAAFVLKLWKEVRKMNGLLTGITQNMSDLLNNDNGGKLSAILSNTECFTLLSQSTIDKEKLMEFLPNISPALFNFVDNAASGTGLLKMGSVCVPFELRMSKSCEIYKIVNTDGGNYGI